MATAASQAALRAAQAHVATVLASETAHGLARLDTRNLRGSLPSLNALITMLVRRYGAATATLAARHYTETRVAAGVPGSFRVIPTDLAPLQQVSSMVGWATRNLWFPAGPVPQAPGPSEEQRLQAAERDLVAGAERLVRNAARDTTAENVRRDPKAVGWYFATDGHPCYFCALIASRGVVFKGDSFTLSDKQFVGDGNAKTHNGCACNLEPVFTTDATLPDVSQKALEVYKNRGKGDPLKAFRKAWDAHLATQAEAQAKAAPLKVT